MSAIVIKADKKSSKLLAELAKKLGGNVLAIDDEQFEGISLGMMMQEAKTGKSASREEVMKKLGDQ